jgi:hypothetical protein
MYEQLKTQNINRNISLLLNCHSKEVQMPKVENLEILLSVIPKSDLTDYGFSDESQLSSAHLGDPFQVFTLYQKTVNEYTNQELNSIISPTNTWYFPIIADGQVRSLLITVLENDTYKGIGIGQEGLAKELAGARTQWPTAKGYRLKFLKVLQPGSQADFVLREGTDRSIDMVPLASARCILEKENKKDAKAAPVLRSLQPSTVMKQLKASNEEF